jgi:hypothetical protein
MVKSIGALNQRLKKASWDREAVNHWVSVLENLRWEIERNHLVEDIRELPEELQQFAELFIIDRVHPMVKRHSLLPKALERYQDD